MEVFDRIGKRLVLNENGRVLLPQALAVLDGAAGIEQLSASDDAQRRELRIGASTTIGNYVLPGLLGSLFPAVRSLSGAPFRSCVTIANTAAICRAVTSFELDLGLIEGPAHDPLLDVRPWIEDQLVIVAAPEHAVFRTARKRPSRDPVPVDALRKAVWLLREAGSGTRETTDQMLLPHLRSFRRSIELGSSEAIKHAAAEGVGLACLSRWVVGELLQSKRLCVVRTELPPMIRPCHLIVHSRKHFTTAAQRLIDEIAAR
jgi:DNA-binding transcriptional LysR family regulator